MPYPDLEFGLQAAARRGVVLKTRRLVLALISAPSVIAIAAFALCLVNIIGDRTYDMGGNPWTFAYEIGVVAHWLVSGHGFSSPYLPVPQPTAWVGPVYPLLLAGVFKLFGVFTNASAFVMLALSSLFSALTCLVVFAIGCRIFSRPVAILSAWAWALLPNVTYWATHWIYYNSLSALMLALAFLLTLRLAGNTQLWKGFGFGLFWAVNLLINASVGSFMVVAIAWLGYQLRYSRRKALVMPAIICLGVAVGMAPWAIRNYRAFGHLVLLRSDFGHELWAGNHPGGTGLEWKIMPWDANRLRQVGELGYMAERGQLALQFIAQNPGKFAVFTLRRIGYFWCDIPEPTAPIGGYPRLIGDIIISTNVRHALYFGFALLAFWGLWAAYRNKVTGAALFAGLFLLFPLVYYVTHSLPRYQFPITPEMVLLAVYLMHLSARQPRTLTAWLLSR